MLSCESSPNGQRQPAAPHVWDMCINTIQKSKTPNSVFYFKPFLFFFFFPYDIFLLKRSVYPWCWEPRPPCRQP